MSTDKHEWNFENLVGTIRQVHEELAVQVGRAVNLGLTMRNWLIGAYIAIYELSGADRASYGDGLLTVLAKRPTQLKVSNCNRRQLYRYLRFYRLYPEIVGTLSTQLKELLPSMDNGLFVSKYQLELPKKEEMKRFIEEQLRETGSLCC